MIDVVKSALSDAANALEKLRSDEQMLASIDKAASLIVDSLKGEGRVFSCGNGGSTCDAMHFAEELTGNFRTKRRALPATAISDPSHITCTANDFGFEEIFSRYVEAHGRKGDFLLAISTSGTSKNIIKATTMAKSLGMSVVSLTGKPGSELGGMVDVDLCTDGTTKYSDRIQELHIKVIHILIELVERKMFPELY